jgi:hypothetical protein
MAKSLSMPVLAYLQITQALADLGADPHLIKRTGISIMPTATHG